MVGGFNCDLQRCRIGESRAGRKFTLSFFEEPGSNNGVRLPKNGDHHGASIIPNVIYLDAEARRWLAPKKNISSLAQDDLSQRWLATYTPTSTGKGSLKPRCSI
jgi:hypothetical protein